MVVTTRTTNQQPSTAAEGPGLPVVAPLHRVLGGRADTTTGPATRMAIHTLSCQPLLVTTTTGGEGLNIQHYSYGCVRCSAMSPAAVVHLWSRQLCAALTQGALPARVLEAGIHRLRQHSETKQSKALQRRWDIDTGLRETKWAFHDGLFYDLTTFPPYRCVLGWWPRLLTPSLSLFPFLAQPHTRTST